MNNERLIFTDGWHPTINPSSRMPIHHHRFVELLGTNEGILCELPRPYGGSTLRAMRIDNEGNILISRLNRTIKYMPWWIPASSDRAIRAISVIIEVAISNEKCIANEVYQNYLKTYLLFAAGNPELTFGEVLNITNNYYYQTIYPELPEIKLNSLTRLPLVEVLSTGLQFISSELKDILSTAGKITNKKEYGLLGIITEYKGHEWRLIYIIEEKKFYIESLINTRVREIVEISIIIDFLSRGMFLPSSQLTAIIELALTQLGYKVTHYGNKYDKSNIFSGALGISDEVEYWKDDEDSWNFVMLHGANGEEYPLHLLDILNCGNEFFEPIASLIKRSLNTRKPVIVELRKGGNLLEALSS